jgi:hypothetical protein
MPALTILAWLTLGVTAKGDVIYNIVDYSNITSPYTVTGTITTNGATGVSLPGTDITAWDITVSSGSGTLFEFTPSTSLVFANFDATLQSITVGTFPDAVDFRSNNSVFFMEWEHDFGADSSNFSGTQNGLSLWAGGLPTADSPVATASAVPEPSSALIAGIGAGALIACVLVRKRREQRRPAADGMRTASPGEARHEGHATQPMASPGPCLLSVTHLIARA